MSGMSASLGQQGRGFAALCPRPITATRLPWKAAEIGVFGRMADERGRQVAERLGSIFLIAQPRCDDDAIGGRHFAIGEGQAEAARRRLDKPDGPAIDVGYGALLKPLAVVDKFFERQKFASVDAALDRISVERQRSVRLRNVGRAPGERSIMPFGIFCRQNAIGSPKTCVATPACLRCAATDSPYGPAPMTATSQELARLDVMMR